MISFSQTISVAEFGSAARGETDGLSDRDFFLVGDDPKELSIAGKRAARIGWSPTCYSWKRLNHSIERGMLFVQHLKHESKILVDPDDRLRARLSAFSPRTDYNSTILDGQRLIAILQNVPSSQLGRYWAADVLAVGVRTVGIAILANEGIYSFSFYSILDHLRKIGVLSASDCFKLSGLREHKVRYRRRLVHPELPWNQLLSLIDIVSKRFRIGFMAKKASPIELLDASREGLSKNWYRNSRLLEGALFGLAPRAKLENEFDLLTSELNHKIRHSGEYSWQLRDGPTYLRQHLLALQEVSRPL